MAPRLVGAGCVAAVDIICHGIKVFDVLRSREVGFSEVGLGPVDIKAGEVHGVVDGFVFVHMSNDILQIFFCDVFVFNEGFDFFFQRPVCLVIEMVQGQGDMAFFKIGSRRFAEHCCIGIVVERVIHQLERHAKIVAKGDDGCFLLFGGVGQQAPEPRADGNHRPGFAVDDTEYMFFGNFDVAGFGVFVNSAFDENFGGFGDGLDNFSFAVFCQNQDGTGNEEIADKNAGVAPPFGVDGCFAAPDGSFIDHIIVEQGGGVDIFDHTPMFNHGVIGFAATEFGAQKGEHGADALPTTTHQIGTDSWNQGHIRFIVLVDRLLNPGEIVF